MQPRAVRRGADLAHQIVIGVDAHKRPRRRLTRHVERVRLHLGGLDGNVPSVGCPRRGFGGERKAVLGAGRGRCFYARDRSIVCFERVRCRLGGERDGFGLRSRPAHLQRGEIERIDRRLGDGSCGGGAAVGSSCFDASGRKHREVERLSPVPRRTGAGGGAAVEAAASTLPAASTARSNACCRSLGNGCRWRSGGRSGRFNAGDDDRLRRFFPSGGFCGPGDVGRLHPRC